MIISAGKSHVAQLAAIHSAVFPKGWEAKGIADMLSVPGTIALLAEGQGMIIIRAVAEQADLITLAVLPECRRRGIARALLHEAMTEAGRMGAEKMFLEVAEHNDEALVLYKKSGFSELSRRPRYYDGKTDAIVMVSRVDTA